MTRIKFDLRPNHFRQFLPNESTGATAQLVKSIFSYIDGYQDVITFKRRALMVATCHFLPMIVPAPVRDIRRMTLVLALIVWSAELDDNPDAYRDLLDLSDVYDECHNVSDVKCAASGHSACYRLFAKIWRDICGDLTAEQRARYRKGADDYIRAQYRDKRHVPDVGEYFTLRYDDFSMELMMLFTQEYLTYSTLDSSMRTSPLMEQLFDNYTKYQILYNDVIGYEKEVLEDGAAMNYVTVLRRSDPNVYHSTQVAVDAIVAQIVDCEERIFLLLPALKKAYPEHVYYFEYMERLMHNLHDMYQMTGRYKVLVLKDVIWSSYIIPALPMASILLIGMAIILGCFN